MTKRFPEIFKAAWLLFCASLATMVLFFPVVISAVMAKTGKTAFFLTGLWARWMCLVSGVKIVCHRICSLNPKARYVIIANHQSLFDIPALMATGLEFRWIIKKELLWIPLFGYGLYAMRNIFIDRTDGKSALESIRKGVDRLPKDVGIMIFPEGTRSPDGQIHEFKKGAFIISIEKQLPILPITINGSRKILPKKSIAFRPGIIEVIIGRPIDPTPYSHDTISEFIEYCRSAMATKFNPDF